MLILLLLFVVSCAPCAKMEAQKPAQPGKAPAPAQKTTVRAVIDGVTGKAAVDQLQGAKEKINIANDRGQQNRDEIERLTNP